jgi:predicted DNA-binding protein YlxM (UPF0122 family)
LGYKRKLTDEMEGRIIARYITDRVAKVSTIAEEFGISRTAIYALLRRRGLKTSRKEQV